MDFWEFLARSEWPIVAAAVFWMLRRPIERKLESTTKATGLGWTFEFAAAGIAKAEALTATEPTDAPSLGMATPEMVILETWRQLVDQITRVQGSRATKSLWDKALFDQRGKELGLTDDEISAFKELRTVRNRVANTVGAPVTPGEAERFRTVTERLRQKVAGTSSKGAPG